MYADLESILTIPGVTVTVTLPDGTVSEYYDFGRFLFEVAADHAYTGTSVKVSH